MDIKKKGVDGHPINNKVGKNLKSIPGSENVHDHLSL